MESFRWLTIKKYGKYDTQIYTNRLTDMEAAETLKTARENILTELKKRIIGQNEVIEQLLIALFSQGHCLLVGVPGLAKTLLISTFAQILELPFNRVQFTPDLMPSDIIGTDIIEEGDAGKRAFRFIKGPVFANIVLADEINQTRLLKPKPRFYRRCRNTRLRQAVGHTHWSVHFLSWQHRTPLNRKAHIPLPEAQLDRFMFHITLDYPDKDAEKEIVMTTTAAYEPEIKAVITGEEVLQIQQVVRKVPIAEAIVDYAVELNRQTRPTADALDFIQDWVQWGAGPRASQYLVLGAKARAILHGRYHVAYEDIKAVAIPVLRHRILTNFNAEADGITSLDIINRLLEKVEPPAVQ